MKRQRQGGNTGESRLLNVGYLQDQDADQAKRQTGKEEIQEKKNEAKEEREFQAECRNLRKMTAIFVECRSRPPLVT